jgi:hypothetical protein
MEAAVTAVPAVTPAAEEKKVEEKKEEKPKPTKRGSIFGSFFEKVKSPTTEKKESEVGPAAPVAAAPAKEADATVEAPKLETAAAPFVPATDGATEAPKTEEAKPATTPAKEKQHFSFGKFLGGAKEKVRSPSAEKAPELPKTEEPAKAEEAAIPAATSESAAVPAPAETAVEAPKETKEETPAAAPAAKPKRQSFFGNFGSVKKEGESEKPQGLSGLFRKASKATKPKKDTPAVAEAKEEKVEEPVNAEDKKEETPATAAETEPAAIGDVVPDAVTVGQAPKSTPQVSTTA